MKVIKSELFAVQIPVDSALTRIPIKLNTNLKSVTLLGLEALTDDILSISPNGVKVVKNDTFKKAILVLNVNGVENVQLPLGVLKRATANTTNDVSVNSFTAFNSQRVDWEKSYIKFGAPVDTSALEVSEFVFLAHYQ